MERSSSQHKPVCVEDTYINYLTLFNLVFLTNILQHNIHNYTHCKYYSTLHFEEIGSPGDLLKSGPGD